MEDLQIKTNPEVELVFDNYPKAVWKKMLALRNFIIQTAKEINGLDSLEETLKWGEPSYLTKNGSTVRIDWKPKYPNHYAIYFQCTSKLVETFRIVFENTFRFEANRAIIFRLDDKIPTEQLNYCVKTALTYHKVKHLPTLGFEY